jgi:hypothetical protein
VRLEAGDRDRLAGLENLPTNGKFPHLIGRKFGQENFVGRKILGSETEWEHEKPADRPMGSSCLQVTGAWAATAPLPCDSVDAKGWMQRKTP